MYLQMLPGLAGARVCAKEDSNSRSYPAQMARRLCVAREPLWRRSGAVASGSSSGAWALLGAPLKSARAEREELVVSVRSITQEPSLGASARRTGFAAHGVRRRRSVSLCGEGTSSHCKVLPARSIHIAEKYRWHSAHHRVAHRAPLSTFVIMAWCVVQMFADARALPYLMAP